MMQSLVRSASAVRLARRFLSAITFRAPLEASRGISSGFGSPWWIESGRAFCCGPQGDLRSATGDSNWMEKGDFAGEVKKETLTTTNNNEKKKKKKKKKKEEEADDEALLRSFEQWMAKYGKVYPTEAQKARRFKYFKDTVSYIEDYNNVHGGEDSIELDESAADPPKDHWKHYRGNYRSLSSIDEWYFG